MNDIGYDGVYDIPDDPLPYRRHPDDPPRCSVCGWELRVADGPSCGSGACPVEANSELLEEVLS